MINNRPKHLLDHDDYGKLPAKPFAVDFGSLPELVRRALGPLGGIQPVTGEMARVANGELHDMPSDGEIKLFKEMGTLFQPIFLVVSIAYLREVNGTPVATPYALSLMPTSKRDVLDEKSIDLVAKLDTQKILREMEPCYAHFDPFTGDRGLFGSISIFIGENPVNCFLDELGIVVGQYYLAKAYDPADVMEVPMSFPSAKAEEKYRQHRANLLYTPFTEIKPRRVWGAQSPIELFLLQELLRRDLSPLLQVLIFDDGSIYGGTSTSGMRRVLSQNPTCTFRTRSWPCSATRRDIIAEGRPRQRMPQSTRGLRRSAYHQYGFRENSSWRM